jgi:HEPN domain-containing protein
LPTPEEVEVADLLLRKAASDLSAARALARDPEQQDDVVGFHAQQAVEKSLKAVLAVRGFEIPRTHDLDLLTRLVGGDVVTGVVTTGRPVRRGTDVVWSWHGARES